jgi:AraC-like DNA-binding protein
MVPRPGYDARRHASDMDTSTPLHTLDFVLRVGLVTLTVFVGALLWRDHARSAAGRLGGALALGVAAYALQSSAGFMGWPMAARIPLAVLSTGNAVVFWLFARAVFDDDFRLRARHALPWLAMAALALFYGLPSARPAIDVLIPLATLGFAGLAVVQSIASWRVDLVERRRRLRVFVVGAGALYTLTNMSLRLLPGSAAELWRGPVELLVLAAIVTLAAWRVLRVPGDLFGLPAPAHAEAPTDMPTDKLTDRPADAVADDPAEAALASRLQALMQADRVYREEGLTIAALAQRLAVPEYRLRRAINQRLGYRNFNAFLNRYRVDEVKAALADPAQAEVPVLTLAMDAGFQSLGPFNRAFKAETGQTPTEFRKTSLG